MEGNINNKGLLKGSVSGKGALSGEVKNNGKLNGHVASGSNVPPYSGEYNIVPSAEPCCLETKGKKMNDNITVWGIPYEAVDNEKGGKTVTIGGE